MCIRDSMTPFRQPPLFVGSRMVVYGFIDKVNASKGKKITLNAKTALGKFQISVDFKLADAIADTQIHKLATRSMLKDLEEKRSYLHDRAFNAIAGVPDSAVKDEMIRLSVKYSVLCKHTAFIAIEARDHATEGTMEIRKGVAAAITKARQHKTPEPLAGRISNRRSSPRGTRKTQASPNFIGFTYKPRINIGIALDNCHCIGSRSKKRKESKKKPAGLSCFDSADWAANSPRPAAKLNSSSYGDSDDDDGDSYAESDDGFFSSASDHSECSSESEDEASPALPTAELTALILKQRASGKWEVADVKSLLKGLTSAQIKSGMPKLSSKATSDAEALWLTAVVAMFLQIRFPQNQTNWQQVVNKAKRFIAKNKKKVQPNIDWLTVAAAFVKISLDNMTDKFFLLYLGLMDVYVQALSQISFALMFGVHFLHCADPFTTFRALYW
eukprot:TRINITY_DN2515_c0_g1_i1.p1 TRINITY_DN2515_c0_g1~~TRINITY_DN2515_c0_g1_i1.p1  ORF type:complete len:443 (-),score=59.65 TRINITY_DN2515_c0_g1_i1:766-2094(-)